MKVAIINKSDSTGGAAVVSLRLAEALRRQGVDVSMLVAEKRSSLPFVHSAASRPALEFPFLAERLRIFFANGFNRETLFKIDTASDGLSLSRNPMVRDADAVMLNWVNQGLLSLKGVRKILALGKPVIWTMHDMWNFTGICHHAGLCDGYKNACGDCPLLGKRCSPGDLSNTVWNKKKRLYSQPGKLRFVAVSSWLAEKASESGLLGSLPVDVIPNAFPFPEMPAAPRIADGRFRVVMGAARLDDPIKGLPLLVEATRVLAARHPEVASRMELVTFGGVRNPESLAGFAVAHRHLGPVKPEDVPSVYLDADAVVSSSLYETLPGTLVEGQAYGCIPVSFDRGGQRDIIDHLSTGFLARRDDNPARAGENLAEGLAWAASCNPQEIVGRMDAEARRRFSADAVAARYISLIESLRR